jgi:hypothetical protein
MQKSIKTEAALSLYDLSERLLTKQHDTREYAWPMALTPPKQCRVSSRGETIVTFMPSLVIPHETPSMHILYGKLDIVPFSHQNITPLISRL